MSWQFDSSMCTEAKLSIDNTAIFRSDTSNVCEASDQQVELSKQLEIGLKLNESTEAYQTKVVNSDEQQTGDEFLHKILLEQQQKQKGTRDNMIGGKPDLSMSDITSTPSSVPVTKSPSNTYPQNCRQNFPRTILDHSGGATTDMNRPSDPQQQQASIAWSTYSLPMNSSFGADNPTRVASISEQQLGASTSNNKMNPARNLMGRFGIHPNSNDYGILSADRAASQPRSRANPSRMGVTTSEQQTSSTSSASRSYSSALNSQNQNRLSMFDQLQLTNLPSSIDNSFAYMGTYSSLLPTNPGRASLHQEHHHHQQQQPHRQQHRQPSQARHHPANEFNERLEIHQPFQQQQQQLLRSPYSHQTSPESSHHHEQNQFLANGQSLPTLSNYMSHRGLGANFPDAKSSIVGDGAAGSGSTDLITDPKLTRRNKLPFFNHHSGSNDSSQSNNPLKLNLYDNNLVNSDGSERYSRKVFVGGLPPDIDEEEIKASFRRFGSLVVDWPHKAESKSYFPPKGYAFLLFHEESSVQALIDACLQEGDKLYLCVSSPTIKDKPVQIRPWRISDADFVLDSTLALDPRKTVFVGGVPRPLKASELANVMNSLYGGVCYAGIDTDPELRYPKGAGRVAFSSHESYIAAVSARFVQLHHSEIDKRVEVKPYVLDDQYCDECQGVRCSNKFAPFFCANINCLRYYCENCWETVHADKEHHKPLVKEGSDRPRGVHHSMYKWS